MPSSRRSRRVSKSNRIRHRRLRIEALEDRRVLAGGLAPELPGMYLVDPDVDKLRGQVIYLDYDGEENVTYNGPVTIGPFDIPPFVAPGALAGQEDAIMVEVAEQLNQLFAPVEVIFTLDRPDAAGTYSTVYIGGDGSWAAEHGQFLGLAEQVDVGNQDPADNAFVFIRTLEFLQDDFITYAANLTGLVSHETGHILGYSHLSESANEMASALDEVSYNMVKLNVPYYAQGYTDWCVPTSLSMVLHSYFPNTAPKPWQVAGDLGMAETDGLVLFEAAEYLNEHYSPGDEDSWTVEGFLNTNDSFAPFVTSYIRSVIDSAHPVILGMHDSEHAIVITGYSGTDDSGTVYVHNPSNVGETGTHHLQTWATFKETLNNQPYVQILHGNSESLFSTIDSGIRPSGVSVYPALYHGALAFIDGENQLPIKWSGTEGRPGYYYDGNSEDHQLQDISPGPLGNLEYYAKRGDVMTWNYLNVSNYTYGLDFSFSVSHDIYDATTETLVASAQTTWDSLEPGISWVSIPSLTLDGLSAGLYESRIRAFGYPTQEASPTLLDAFSVYFGVVVIHPISVTSGPNGGIAPSGLVNVLEGEMITFTASPAPNYSVDRWYVGGEEIPALRGSPELVLTNVSGSGTILVTFKQVPEEASLTVTSPALDSNWARRSMLQINWESQNLVGEIKLELYKGGEFNRIIIAERDVARGSYRWRIPSNLDLGEDYRVKATSLSSGVAAFSGHFSIRPADDSDDPIPISTYAQLLKIGSGEMIDGRVYHRDADYTLTTNINANGQNVPTLHELRGTLDGQGYEISNIVMNRPEEDGVALFPRIRNTATVKNLNLRVKEITGRQSVATLAVYNDGTIENVHVYVGRYGIESNAPAGTWGGLGGLVAENYGSILNSSLQEDPSDPQGGLWSRGHGTGGIAAFNGGLIRWSFVSVNYGHSNQKTGGIAGENEGIIRECFVTGEVSGDRKTGGIAGTNESGGVILDCMVEAMYGGRLELGGIAGSNWSQSSVRNNLVVGPSRNSFGANVAALVGENRTTVERSFWDTETTGFTADQGIGSDPQNLPAIESYGLPTAQLKQMATFTAAGWDFENVWMINEGVDYPRLRGARPSLDSVVSGLTATVGAPGRISLSWNSVPEATAYRVFRADFETGKRVPVSDWIADTSFDDRAVVADDEYFYWVTAAYTNEGAGESRFSSFASGSAVFQPAPPASVSASNDLDGLILIEWAPVAGIGNYRVYRSSSEMGVKEPVTDWFSGNNFVDTGTIQGHDYHYWVQSAVNAQGDNNSEYSTPAIGRQADPELWVDPMQRMADFGEVAIGNTVDKPITVYNVGNGTLVVYATSGFSTPFSIDPTNESGNSDDWTIVPGASKTFRVAYSPILTGSHSAVLTLYSNDPDHPEYTIELSGVSVPKQQGTLDIAGRTVDGRWYLAASSGESFDTQYWGLWGASNWTDVMSGDFNGDGRADIAGRLGNLWYVGLNNGDSFSTTYWGLWGAGEWTDVMVGDFTGDGRADIAGRLNNRWYVASSTGSSFQTSYWGIWGPGEWTDVMVGDFTGNGRADIAGRFDNRWYVASSTGSSFQTTYWGLWGAGAWTDVMAGDFNRDGKTDIAGRFNNRWYVALSTGSSFQTTYWGLWGSGAWTDVMVGDFTGDGRADIAGRLNNAWYVASSTGSSFQTTYWGLWGSAMWNDVRVGDFDGDGRDDIAGRLNDGRWFVARSEEDRFQTDFWGLWDRDLTWLDVLVDDFAL